MSKHFGECQIDVAYGREVPSLAFSEYKSVPVHKGETIVFEDLSSVDADGICWGYALIGTLGKKLWFQVWDKVSLFFKMISENEALVSEHKVNYGGVYYDDGNPDTDEGVRRTYSAVNAVPLMEDGTNVVLVNPDNGGTTEIEWDNGYIDESTMNTYSSQRELSIYETDEYKDAVSEFYANNTTDVGDLMSKYDSGKYVLKKNMRLFGLPFQFTSAVDPRIPGVSKNVGLHFATNQLIEAPTVTLIPGKPKYLGNDADKDTTTTALLEAASGKFAALKEKMANNGPKYLRYYDFQRSYMDYIGYVWKTA